MLSTRSQLNSPAKRIAKRIQSKDRPWQRAGSFTIVWLLILQLALVPWQISVDTQRQTPSESTSVSAVTIAPSGNFIETRTLDGRRATEPQTGPRIAAADLAANTQVWTFDFLSCFTISPPSMGRHSIGPRSLVRDCIRLQI
jgi:hypothetical protein